MAPPPTRPATGQPNSSPFATRRYPTLTPLVDAAVARDTLQRVGELGQLPVDGVRITVGGRAVASETTLTAAGPSVLTLITALGELGLTVSSTYVGHDGTATLATHLVVSRDRDELDRVEHSRDSLPVIHARERCLLDHAVRVQEAVGELVKRPVAVDVAPATLARAAFV